MCQDSRLPIKTLVLMIPLPTALELNRSGRLLREIANFTSVKPQINGDLRVEYVVTERTDFDNLPMAVDAYLRYEGYIEDVTAKFNNGPRTSSGAVYSDAYDDEIDVTILSAKGQEWLYSDNN